MEEDTQLLYREVQRPHQSLWWVSTLLVTILMWYWFIQQIIFGVPLGNNPASDTVTIIVWAIFGILFPLFMFGIFKLIIEVRVDGIYIRMVPFHFKYKQYLFSDIKYYEFLTYSPIKRFGGWGLRLNPRGEKAYNLNGREGVELLLEDRTVLIGTQNLGAFKQAVDSILK